MPNGALSYLDGEEDGPIPVQQKMPAVTVAEEESNEDPSTLLNDLLVDTAIGLDLSLQDMTRFFPPKFRRQLILYT